MEDNKMTEVVEVVEPKKTEEVKQVKLQDTLRTANEVTETMGIAIQDAQSGKLQVGTVSRLVALILVWVNQLVLLYGGTNYAHLIPEVSESTIYLVSAIITIVVSIYCYLKSGYGKKPTSELIANAVQNTGVTLDSVAGAIDGVIEECNKAKAEKEKIKETSIDSAISNETKQGLLITPDDSG